ncbi:Aerobic cobaltochelatase subunit CobN [Seminavis robusta]|uniref:Aerobic cobaltochelatase subunit CobN n=1 Tax=Seminavis robusta TaxID=568900 RepID=A0A9N8HZD0_9STRA|nr:Aerobic cobaltochelatase subunit CobN [Seminavis robusta]|eukprot:Sro2863_g338860.1 Aerobic cobaltochelatase subunit CobN (1505) ;mRNA; r:3409-8094
MMTSSTSAAQNHPSLVNNKFLLLSHKDTDALTLNATRHLLPLDFPTIQTGNLCALSKDEDMKALLDRLLGIGNTDTSCTGTVAIVVRLLGRGVPGMAYLLESVVKKSIYAQRTELIVVSGVPGSMEPDLTAMCTVSMDMQNHVVAYFNADGCAHNMGHMFRFLADHLMMACAQPFGYNAPTPRPNHGLYHPSYVYTNSNHDSNEDVKQRILLKENSLPTVAVLFYRCHFLSGNTAFVDALLDELEASGVNAVGLFTESLRECEPHDNVNGQAVERFPKALAYLLHDGKCKVDVLISTMAFAMGEVNPDGPTLGSWATAAIQALNVPVLQATNSVGTRASWEQSTRGLNPLDTAMNVVIPEFDGRIITVPISFMAPQDESNTVMYYEALQDRVEAVAKQATKIAKNLRHKDNRDKRVAFLLTNTSGKAQRIGDAVGLDTPASLMKLFEAMQAAGYQLGHDLPPDGDTLFQNLIDRCSYDEIYLTEHQLAHAAGRVPSSVYQKMYQRLPRKQKEHMEQQWGQPPGEAYVHQDSISLAGLEFGNVFVALQPPRGYGMDPDKIYHTPDLPPPHNYYALYRWLRDEWKADAIVHMGKHGTLEWLPGKGVGLSHDCYPDTFLDDMPLIYPFILNDPGEGTQAKRRAHALIIDHLTPPMTTADGYGELAQLMQLVDEYYQVEMLDPSKLPLIQRQIWDLIQQVNLGEDLEFLLNHDHDGDHDHDTESHNHGHEHAHTESDHNHHDHGHDHKEVSDHNHHDHGHAHKEETSHNHHEHHSHHDHGHAHKEESDHNHHDHGHDHKEVPDRNHHNHGHDHKEASDHNHHDHGHALKEESDHKHHDHGHAHKEVSDHNHHDHHGHANEDGQQYHLEHIHAHKQEPHDNHAHEHDHGHGHDWDGSVNDHGTPDALAKMDGKDVAHLMEHMDGYLCELAGAQIRDGLHILGQVPQGDQMVDTLQALTRLPNLDIPSLPQSIARMFGLSLPELEKHQGARIRDVPPMLTLLAGRPLATSGDVVQTIDELTIHLLTILDQKHFDAQAIPHSISQTFPGNSETADSSEISRVLEFVCGSLVPSLRDTTQEIKYLLTALRGEFVPAGPSGSPTRGNAHVLPTGRNFYAVDPRALPSMAAWDVGQGLANEVLSRFLKETKAYPEHVAISVWGTAAMRTHGDDIAEIFALLGVRPIWQRENHRVTGVELIPLDELGHPRIDVTIRISGFFRDAFPHLITLLDEAVNLAINADEPIDQNFIRKHYLEDIATEAMDEASARYRVYGCPPGAYGIGILDLIEAQNWKDESDFAECYVNWGGYAYSQDEPEGIDARHQFTHRLTSVEVAIHNQDDREHDIFDSDDYFQFHGGMIATIKALSGKRPKGYFGDSANPANPKVRDIKEESLRVYRTRVINPKWLESISRHGYKGASEMAATVDYMFGFDATAGVVSDHMYEQMAQTYALNEGTQEFFEKSNPWALKGISDRLLEAAQRGMWADPNPETLEALRQTLLKTDSMVEGRTEPTI